MWHIFETSLAQFIVETQEQLAHFLLSSQERVVTEDIDTEMERELHALFFHSDSFIGGASFVFRVDYKTDPPPWKSRENAEVRLLF